MTNLKIYTTLAEALKDIDFGSVGHGKIVEIGFDKELGRSQPPMQELESWLETEFKQQEENVFGPFRGMLRDLADNAYENGIGTNHREHCFVEAYVGQKGALLGTRQNTNFLTEEQIKLLLAGKKVPSTSKSELSQNYGTERFVTQGDGLLIIAPEKAIYVSKYFSKLPEPKPQN